MQKEPLLPFMVAMSGWFALTAYLYVNYSSYGPGLLALITDPAYYTGNPYRILLLLSPLMSTIVGYALDQRIRLINQKAELDTYYKDLAEQDLRELLDSLILAFANALDAKSPWTKGHSERVCNYSLAIAEAIGMGAEERDALRVAALLHDIGKIGTYDDILNKTGKLTEEEYALIKAHPDKGVKILSPINHLSDILPAIRHHHERYDGRGYPDGIRGEKIPLMARILGVADSFDAITSERPYKVSMNMEDGIREIIRCSSTHFDPDIVPVFVNTLQNQKPL